MEDGERPGEYHRRVGFGPGDGGPRAGVGAFQECQRAAASLEEIDHAPAKPSRVPRLVREVGGRCLSSCALVVQQFNDHVHVQSS
jgi:hypothetical protein